MAKSKKLSRRIRRPQRLTPLNTYALFMALSFVLLASFMYIFGNHASGSGRLVTIHDRGEDRVILTRATTVQQALAGAKIVVEPQDLVEPALTSELTSTDSGVIIYRSRPVLIVDGALKQKVVTAAAAPNEILNIAGMDPLQNVDKSSFTEGNVVADGASIVLTIERGAITPIKQAYVPGPNALTKSRGAQMFTDSGGIVHRETYYDLPMNIVIGACGPGDYTIRSDGAKIDKDGYVLVAASYRNYPKCSIVETSMGPGKVYDTGGFALRYPHGFDLATDWTNFNGR